MSFTHIETLRGLRLPETGRLRRDHVRAPKDRTEKYLKGYDDLTVIYDCVRRPDGRGLLLTAPPLLNLWDPLRTGLTGDCKSLGRSLRRWRHKQTDLVFLRKDVQSLSLTLDNTHHDIPIRDSLADRFAGLNAMFLVNKDNKLDWIRSCVRYYIEAHGLEALVLFDNGSTTYSMEDLIACLEGCGALKTIVIYQAPFPFGPSIKSSGKQVIPRFLQVALLNLARVDVLSRARAVLNVDVDELIHVHDGRSIFDMAAEHPQTMIKVHGSWIYPDANGPMPATQPDHVYRATPNNRCNQKWCAVPNGMLSRFGWGVHHVGGRFVKLINATPGAELYHCRGTSTAWKANRFALPPTLKQDPELTKFMQKWFPRT